MLLRIPAVLGPEALAQCRAAVLDGPWADGRETAGAQSARVKNNRQLAEDSEAAATGRRLVLQHLARSALFVSAALPKKIFPPLFNRYEGAANAFGSHVDNAMRTVPGTQLHVRTDLAATLFLSDPDSYDGGELVVEGAFGQQAVKLPAGDLILYPGSSVHHVTPVTRGARVACFFWVESMVRGADERRVLFDMDLSIRVLRDRDGESDVAVRLTGCYQNLVRMWADS
jgi:PKHD-type hydroxylase